MQIKLGKLKNNATGITRVKLEYNAKHVLRFYFYHLYFVFLNVYLPSNKLQHIRETRWNTWSDLVNSMYFKEKILKVWKSRVPRAVQKYSEFRIENSVCAVNLVSGNMVVEVVESPVVD